MGEEPFNSIALTTPWTAISSLICEVIIRPIKLLACATDCLGWDTSGCSTCGNDVIEADEVCDGAQFGGEDCASFSAGQHGILACNATCDEVDLTGCYTCGNDTREAIEECDGADFGGQTCVDYGFAWGRLSSRVPADCLLRGSSMWPE